MIIDLGDVVAVVAAVFAGLAWWQARRSANSDTTLAKIANGELRGRLAQWSPERMHKPDPEVRRDGARRGRVMNSGDELALKVVVKGERVVRQGEEDEVAVGHGVEFEYRVSYEGDGTPPPEAFYIQVVWDRPEHSGGGRRMETVRFAPRELPRP
ncbi:hypothetical protein FHX37_0617 [Haloactinospora alba]|uniref:Uncharacterized protein n=2 Tax=Nocardiopsidaceae TaxID=83676 RepID=A0A3N0EAC0_9ACTN|nr:hypothetical protein [Haloactinospora alba]RNL84770.1 hypothetical protein EFW17_10745 [Nocardiopsaceae bacterium YIM 96095]TQN30735.1 hypothetical protein FHX37_0617 [Haloactinospora alba]